MRVGTNENIKNVNENIQNFERVNTEKQELNSTKYAQNGNKCNLEETQRIIIVKELIKDTEKSKKEFSVNCPAKNQEQGKKNNIENLNSENVTNIERSVQNVSHFILKEPEQNILSEKRMQNKIGQDGETSQFKEKEAIYSLNSNKHTNITTTEESAQTEEQIREKERKHFQDKKDFRLERMLFDRINAMQGKIKESLELIKKFERINAKEENLPNIVTTLHDKLTQEVIKQFRTVGIEFNMKSYLVQSIVSDLLNKFEEGISEFKDCSENLNFVREVQEDFESKVELVSTSKVKNLIARLRGLFKPERKQEKLEQLERERQEKKLEEANIHLIKYKFKNSELEKYTIKNNIVSSLTREILFGPGSGLNLTVNEFIEQKISYEMRKLGLQDLITQLKEQLYSEYKDKHNNSEKESFFNMQIGEIKKNMKATRVGYIRTKVNVLSQKSAEEQKMAV